MTLEQLVQKVAEFEGFRGVRYTCPAGVLTIGYGATASCFADGKVPQTIAKEEAYNLLFKTVSDTLVKVVNKLDAWGYKNVPYDVELALTDFAYNCGMLNLGKLTINGLRTLPEIAEKITLYCNANGKPLNGLLKRRAWERDIILEALAQVPLKTYCVQDVQAYLNDVMGYKLAVDGKAGKLTCTAIMETFEKLNKK